MSKPFTNYEDPIHGAISEIISGLSSLNMDPQPIEGVKGYLSETDVWAKHAVEHLKEAIQQCRKASDQFRTLKSGLKHRIMRVGIKRMDFRSFFREVEKLVYSPEMQVSDEEFEKQFPEIEPLDWVWEKLKDKSADKLSDLELRLVVAYHHWKDGADADIVRDLLDDDNRPREELLEDLNHFV